MHSSSLWDSGRGLPTSKFFAILCALLGWALGAVFLASGQYAVNWWAVGGGGTSTGGVYVVRGAAVQPDATATLRGGQFTLTAAFWSLIGAVQTPGAPLLSVAVTNNTVVVSWPLADAHGWTLQSTNSLPSIPAPWPAIPPPYQTNGPNLQVVEPVPVGTKFYRLYKN